MRRRQHACVLPSGRIGLTGGGEGETEQMAELRLAGRGCIAGPVGPAARRLEQEAPLEMGDRLGIPVALHERMPQRQFERRPPRLGLVVVRWQAFRCGQRRRRPVDHGVPATAGVRPKGGRGALGRIDEFSASPQSPEGESPYRACQKGHEHGGENGHGERP